MRRIGVRRNRRSGASLVEFAFVAPIFFLIMFGVFEYARFLFTVQLMNNAAREGARYAVVNLAETDATVKAYVDKYLVGQGANQLVGYNSTSNISVYQVNPTTGATIPATTATWQSATWGTAVGVSVSGTYRPLLPGLLKLTGSMTLTASSVVTVEGN